jgi:hydroxyacylglutathione hydrolase
VESVNQKMKDIAMRQIQPDLWETESYSPFPGLKTHAYLLKREDGNVLFYNPGHSSEVRQLAELGGVARQYLSHEDELGEAMNEIAELYGSILIGHQAEAEKFSEVRAPDKTFSQRETHLENIDVIPTPGHSPGSTCFLVHSPTGKKYLFTGDTLFLNDVGKWQAGFIGGIHTEQDRADIIQSLKLLRDIKPDVVIGSGYTGDEGFTEISPENWQETVDQATACLVKAGT